MGKKENPRLDLVRIFFTKNDTMAGIEAPPTKCAPNPLLMSPKSLDLAKERNLVGSPNAKGSQPSMTVDLTISGGAIRSQNSFFCRKS